MRGYFQARYGGSREIDEKGVVGDVRGKFLLALNYIEELLR
jgi:hypothetical protein